MKYPTSKKSSSNILSLATAPFLLGVVAAQALTQALIDLGQASEEVFRGDRLPVLHFPEPEKLE